MRVHFAGLVAGLGLGLLAGACGSFEAALKSYCEKASNGGCSCETGTCCINDGFLTDDAKYCCAGPRPLRLADGGMVCCSANGCLGPDGGNGTDAGGTWPDGGGGLGAPCTLWDDCWHVTNGGGWTCAYDGGAASCQEAICWVGDGGSTSECGSQVNGTGVVTLSGGGRTCGLPGYQGTIACCFDRCANGSLCSCLTVGHCTCDAVGCTSTDTNFTCPK